MMSKIIPIIYMVGVLILVLPSFLHSNSNFKIILRNFSIWVALLLVLMTVYILFTSFI